MKLRYSLDDSKEEIYEAYQNALTKLRKERFLNKQHKEHKKEIIKKKNKKINNMSYKHYRMTQVLWGVNKRIEKLKGRYKVHQKRGRVEGYRNAVSRMARPFFKTNNPARMVGMIDLMQKTMGIRLDECSFLLWANTYDFFTVNDFKRDMSDTNIQYYSCLVKLKNKGHLMKMEHGKEFGKFKFCLTGTGKSLASRIDKFIKKVS